MLVVRDAAAWLRDCLHALASQTYKPLAVLAVDNASTDGSKELLEQALGPKRVLALREDAGLAGSVRAALELSAAREADYLLVTHDDAALDDDAIARLVEAANLEGVERVGVVGPKVVDWENPRILREVGRSTDRFGHPYTPLQDGELDQGQFDRVLEVLFVSSVAMLVSRECLQRVGQPDERFTSHHEDLDFCWRARLAGFRVLMTPLARARHVSATAMGVRDTGERERSERYYGDRAALASMLKNYRLMSLLVLLPLYAVLGLARVLWLTLTRRFDGVIELLAAWGWNIAHLPGTLRRRFRAQRTRVVPDRAIARFMDSAGLRLPRWFEAAGQILAEQRELEDEDADVPVGKRLRHQSVSLAREHPVLVASFLGLVIGGFAFRGLLGPAQLFGGALPMFPERPDGFLTELLSGYRTTGFGGTAAASPALGAMGGLSSLLFSSGWLAQKVMLAGGFALGAVFSYRGLSRRTGSPFAAAVAATAYSLSAVVLWAYSEGRIGLIAAVAALPVLVDRFEWAFGTEPPAGRVRFVVGLGLVTAVGVAFEPGLVPAIAVLAVIHVVGSGHRGRGLPLLLAGLAIGAVLVFPTLPGLVAGGGRALSSQVGGADISRLGRFVPSPPASGLIPHSPGSGSLAWFLPAAAALGFALVRPAYRGPANRAMASAIAGIFLAWGSAAGYVPVALSNAPVYTVMGAASAASLVAFGVASILGVRSESFGIRQLGAGALTGVLAVGVLVQTMVAVLGGWAIGGPEAIPPAWAVAASGEEGEYRVLWLGADDGSRFPAPGGDPQGVVEAGASSLRYGVTGRDGVTALDVGRGPAGAGDDYLRAVLDEIIAGGTDHGGALLAPLGVRLVVAEEGDLPPAVEQLLAAQVDLNLRQASGLTIYLNAKVLPLAGEFTDAGDQELFDDSSLAAIERLPDASAEPMTPVPGGWDGGGAGGRVFVSTEYSSAWRVNAIEGSAQPVRAFGWALASTAPTGPVHVRFTDQWMRTAEMVALGILWAAALWITRRPTQR
ncbi:MAG TPA: glycosyltransferase family 2 protein [Actinomycetota bacterium]|nr:glycosyltransferase family 2 protein [Actinomycetota bacterium]